MNKKIKITEMPISEVAKWYQRIKPIVFKNGQMRYVRPLTNNELKTSSFYAFYNENDLGEVVDFNTLYYMKDIKMLHSYAYSDFFNPTVSEVISQIPEDLINDVVAFEIIMGGICLADLFKAELHSGYHVSIVRLYQARGHKKKHANPVSVYPSNTSNIPIGMTKLELKDIQSKYLIKRLNAK